QSQWDRKYSARSAVQFATRRLFTPARIPFRLSTASRCGYSGTCCCTIWARSATALHKPTRANAKCAQRRFGVCAQRGPFLHDGRAVTIGAAIRARQGEARIARDRFLALTLVRRRQLLEFLSSL